MIADILAIIDTDILLTIVLTLIMFSVGLALKVSDFKYVLQESQLILMGLVLKMVIIPLLVFFALEYVELPLVFKLGILIMLICPGGTTSNVISFWSNGTIALTILLTTFSSIISVFTIPPLINLLNQHYFDSSNQIVLPVLETVFSIISIIILPAFIGIVINHYLPKFSDSAQKILKPVSVIMLAFVFILKFFASEQSGGTGITVEETLLLSPLLFTINILGIILGFLIPKFMKFNNQDSMTIGIELGLQNVGLTLFVGGVLMGNQDLIKPALIYSMFTFWTSAFFGFAINRLYRKGGLWS